MRAVSESEREQRPMPLPKDRRSPTDCAGGWFYVNYGSITTVAPPDGNGLATVTRRQLEAALKLMPKKRKSNREVPK